VAKTGADSAECGLVEEQPCQTISQGVTRAVEAARATVHVQAGDYPEVLVLKPGVRVLGGFDDAWESGDLSQEEHRVVVQGGREATSQEYVAVWAHNLEDAAALQNLVVVGPLAQGRKAGTKNGRSSYAVHAVNAKLSLENVEIQAGSGAPGAAGDDGQDAVSVSATDGMSGGVGGDGAPNSIQIDCDDETTSAGGLAGLNVCADSPSNVDTTAGKGGFGGARDTRCNAGPGMSYVAQPGGDGADAAGAMGEASRGGARGSGGGPVTANPNACGATEGGTSGAVANGAGGKAAGGGKLESGFWYGLPGGDGATGQNGTGGGGGGGSGACDALNKTSDSRGAGGGGGGAGGCAARSGGGGGGAGGGSFGLFALASTLQVEGVSVVRGTAGDGGNGGSGGQGQSGGLGREGGLHPGTATPGKGGNGAHGGHSGGGAGGGGGSSYAALLGEGSALNGALAVSGGAVGKGGVGGVSAPTAAEVEADGNDGEAGLDGALGDKLDI
jgi:hypothetical protein